MQSVPGKNKPIACECYGVTCLAFARSQENRRSIIWGRHVTGHPIEYDYHDNTGFGTRDTPGAVVRTPLMLTTDKARARSFTRLTICAPFTPTAGSIS